MFDDLSKELTECRICHHPMKPKLSLHNHVPLANNLIDRPGAPSYRFPLDLRLCDQCFNIQLGTAVRPDILFENYLFVSGTTKVLCDHHEKTAFEIKKDWCDGQPGKVHLDIACNDGTMMRAFMRAGFVSYGVDPAENLVAECQKTGLQVEPAYWSRDAGYDVLDERKAHVITAFNVMAHVFDLHEFMDGVKEHLHPDGVFVCEFPYAVTTFDLNQWDSIYHEHLSYYMLSPLLHLLSAWDLAVVETSMQPVYGGSLRVVAKHCHKVKDGAHGGDSAEVQYQELNWLRGSGCPFEKLGQRIALQKHKLEVMCENHDVAGYGAPAKATTLLNVFDLKLPYVVDENPLKIGKYIPGVDTLICDPSRIHAELKEGGIKSVLPLAWNYNDSIRAKFPNGTWFVLLPEVVAKQNV